jgi:hypothetical protein
MSTVVESLPAEAEGEASAALIREFARPDGKKLPIARKWGARERGPLPAKWIALAGLVIGISVLVATTLTRQLSTDVFWQLAAGQWMLAHHHVIGLDPFSYTESHHRWVADEWGSEVILASLYKVFGVAAYNIISIATGTLCLLATAAYARTLGARGGRLAAILVLVAVGISGFVTQDRGLSFSLIWLPLELLILNKARANARWLWWLPPLCLLWVNTHGSILVGLAVIGVELGWSMAPSAWITRVRGIGRAPVPFYVALAGIGSLAASFISPYGPGLLLYDLKVATNSQIGQYISEWKSPDFHSVMILLLVGVPLVVFILSFRNRPHLLLETTLTALFFVGTLHSVRVAIYLIIAAVGLAAALPARPEWGGQARRLMGCAAIGLMIALVAMPSAPAGTVTSDTPVQAFNFLELHPGRIFTEYTWADYSIARHRQTFVDGRTDLFVGPVLTDFFAVSNLTTDPDTILSKYEVSYVLWEPDQPLSEFLAHDAKWVEVDHTSQSVTFARRSVRDGQS